MSALSKLLPNPKYNEGPGSTSVLGRGTTVKESSSQQLVNSGVPAYGLRQGWLPKSLDDFGDGGAYPEINIAQYPLEMGLKSKKSSGGALAVQVDSEGKVQYDAIAKQGRDAASGKIIHTSFKDLIPIRNRVNAGEISLERPSEEAIQETADRTNAALQMVVTGQLAASRPKTVKTQRKGEPTYIRYTPSNQMGEASDVAHTQRIIKMVDLPEDPLEPPKHRHRKVPRGPGSPPPPVMHSPPRKITAKEQQDWVIPPSISNWKNSKGYTIALDKRLAADGRGLQDVSINDNFAKLSEALYMADRHAREEVRTRSLMQQKIAQKEKDKKEEHLRQLAQKARENRYRQVSPERRSRSRSIDSRRSRSVSDSPHRARHAPTRRHRRSESESGSEDENVRERERLRRERRQDAERTMRVGKMGRDARIKHMERETDRDISEKIALGLAKPTASKESMYDQRLFNQTSGMDSGFGADDSYNLYDKPLFANRDVANAIYRPFRGQADDDADGDETVENVTRESRFEVLGRAGQGFSGVEHAEPRDGPVQFEKDTGEDVHAPAPPAAASAATAATSHGAADKYGVAQVLEEAKQEYPTKSNASHDVQSRRRPGNDNGDDDDIGGHGNEERGIRKQPSKKRSKVAHGSSKWD